MSPIDLQDRAQYLSLALFSQKVVSALMEFADEGRSSKLQPALKEVSGWLLQTKAPSSASFRRRVAALPSYEHLRTIDEVWSARERRQAAKIVRAILRSPQSHKTKGNAETLIDLFSKLQNQALWNFEQPRPVSPKVMSRLCHPA